MRKLKEKAPLLFMTFGFYYVLAYFRIFEYETSTYGQRSTINTSWRIFRGASVEAEGETHPSLYLIEPENLTQASNCTDWKRDSYEITHICSIGPGESNDVILTLFTAVIDYTADQTVFDNTLMMHSQLRPHVQPVLFVPSPAAETALVQKACSLGWHVLTAPQCDGAMLPVLKYMFLAAQEIQKSVFYGYVNAEVLFDDSIITTLEALHPLMEYFPRHLIIGKKFNLQVQNEKVTTLDELKDSVERSGTDGWVADVEYFISSSNGYPWADIPKVLIGRSGYDNWLVRNSEKIGIPVIDISSTTLAVRQVSGYKPNIPYTDLDINLRITGGFDYTKGLITCAPYKTVVDTQEDVVLVKRVKSGMCGAEDWRRRREDRYGVDVDEPFNVDDGLTSAEQEEQHLANLTRKVPPTEPSQYLVDKDHLELVKNCSYWNATELALTRICSPVKPDAEVLITLFTTMHDSKKSHYLYENVIHLHSLLQPKVQPMLFVSSPVVEKDLIRDACAMGWHVLTAPTCNKNKLPVLRDMFLVAEMAQKSTFYGYANGDIIFDESLIKTLEHMDTIKQRLDQALFVGSRTNIQLSKRQVIPDLDNLRVLAAKKGKDGWVAAEDYFITTRNGFPWKSIPPVVIGRVGYDNWMVSTATKKHMFAVDISNTTLSVHQVGQTGYYSSHRKRDTTVNLKLLGKFDFTRGLISCTPFKTIVSPGGSVKIMRRRKLGMCGAGHWVKRRNPDFGSYGHEVLEDFDPVQVKKTKRSKS